MRKHLRRIVSPPGSLRGQLLRGSVGSAGIKAFYVLVQFGIGIILARMLGPEALGVYAFTMAMVNLLVIGVQCGFPAFLVREVAVSRAQDAYSGLKRLLFGSGQIVLIASLLLFGTGIVGIWGFDITIKGISPAVSLMGLLLVPLLALTATGAGAIRGLGHVIEGQIPSEVVRPFLFLMLLLVIYAAEIALTPEQALLVHGFAATVALLLAGFILLQRLPASVRQATAADIPVTELLRQSFPFLLLAGAQVLNYQTDVLMLGFLASAEDVGQYRVSVEFSSGVGAVLVAISTAIAPMLARLHAKGDLDGLQSIMINAHRAGLAITILLSALFFLYGEAIISFFFGNAYLPALEPLMVLLLGRIIYAINVHSGVALSMFGFAWIAMWLTGISVALNVAMNLVLVPVYGTVGAATATSVTMVLVTIAGQIWLWRYYGRGFSAVSRK